MLSAATRPAEAVGIHGKGADAVLKKTENEFHRALALPPSWQLTASGSGHVLAPTATALPGANSNSSNGAGALPSSPSPQSAESPAWAPETVLSEAYPAGARTPLRRSPTPEHQPPQLPDPEAIAMQLRLLQQPQPQRGSLSTINTKEPVLLFEKRQMKARASVAGSPYEDMVVPELEGLQSRASMAAAAEELRFTHGGIVSIGSIYHQHNLKKADNIIQNPKAVAGFAEMLLQTAPPGSNTKSMTGVIVPAPAPIAIQQPQPQPQPQQQPQPQRQTQKQKPAPPAAINTGSFDDLDSLGLLDGLDTAAAPGSANSVATIVATAAGMQLPTPSGFTGELTKFFAGSASAAAAAATAVTSIAEVPESAAPAMDVDAHNSSLATPVLTSAPADSPFGSPSPLGHAAAAAAAAHAAAVAAAAANGGRRSGRTAKKTQPFDNSSSASGGAPKSGKGRRACAALATRGTAGKGGKLAASGASYAHGASIGKKAPAALTRTPVAQRTARKAQPTLAALDATGTLSEDHKPARGRGRQLQLAKMTPAQKKAEAKARLEKNRQAARGFRARRKNHVFELEQQIADYEQRDRDQLNTIHDLQQQIARMQQLAAQ